MQNLYDEVGSLDKRCYEKYALTEELLMEHASNSMAEFIRQKFVKDSKVIIVCGGGNNGADGIALARLLDGDYDVSIFYAKKPKSEMALLQNKRSKSLNINECKKLKDCDLLVDAIVGTGFNGKFNEDIEKIINKMNLVNAYKIACDVPSGYKFIADITLTMGALKKSLYLDKHKDFVADIKVLDLGVHKTKYEIESNWKLLDYNDMNLPTRVKKDSHKGSFGHLVVLSGEKSGASILSANAALKFGAGLVTLVGFKEIQIPSSIMFSNQLPENTTAIALGMGLGNDFSKTDLSNILDNKYHLICDADIFYNKIIKQILERQNVVLTPHPKEFVELLRNLDITDITVEKLQNNRFKYVELFCERFPDITLLLKGANVIIAKADKFFINSYGSAKLAKAGSGDVLSGLIGALLAQGYETLDATITSSLAHTKLAQSYSGADFSLTPDDLIDGICKL